MNMIAPPDIDLFGLIVKLSWLFIDNKFVLTTDVIVANIYLKGSGSM